MGGASLAERGELRCVICRGATLEERGGRRVICRGGGATLEERDHHYKYPHHSSNPPFLTLASEQGVRGFVKIFDKGRHLGF